jgi:electron transfer flavoprotein beta subunit
LEITEKQGGTVTTVTVGLADTEASIRKALAIGATDAVRINADPTDAYFVAEQIAAYAKDQGFDLILTGRESIDYNGGQVAGLLGEMLSLPSINVVTAIDVENGVATMERDIDGGKEKLSCKLPLVASAQKELTEPRIPNMRGIMAARTKPLTVVESAAANSTSATVAFDMPAAKGACKMITPEDAAQLIDLLHNEAKII